MAEDAKGDEYIEPLRDAFVESLRGAGVDLPAHQVLQLADALCTVQLHVLAGERIRYRSLREVDGAAITEDWRLGLSLEEIRRKHKVSKVTAYKYHPSRATQLAKAG